jgi:transcriptional regulator with GAF, ATPase, and Fis domain/truncated hemoglobin YjbI
MMPEIIGSSPALLQCLHRVDAVAPTDATVLVLGESGVGKELVARRIHDRSRRATGPLVVVNCAAIPRDLFESEFFGHVKGAFSGATRDRKGRLESAHRGTLFLDEVGEIPPESQGKLLRALQQMSFERVGDDHTRQVDVRVIAATNRSLLDEVSTGRFRRDLYYRLSTLPIDVPPLRERPEDIGPLSAHLLSDIASKLSREVPHLSAEQIERLRAYDWPGNVRELRNVLERYLILGHEPNLARILPVQTYSPVSAASSRDPVHQVDGGFITASEFVAFERNNLIAALEAANWKVAGHGGTAELLGMNASTLASRLRALGIARPAATSLYVRVGGRARIAAMSRDLLGRMQADPQVGRFWRNRSTAGIRQEEKLLVAYLCSALGGPSRYEGRDMLSAHAHLDITASDWSVFRQHLSQTFEALALEPVLRAELREAVDGLKDSIVKEMR